MSSSDEGAAFTRQPSVLIVDDEPHIVEFLQMGFSYEGFLVFVATNGPDALRLVKEQQPDILILDIMLPGLDGIQVTRHIRQMHETPIIMLTAKDDVEDLVTGLDIGADDYVTKPFVFKALMARVRAVMRRHGNTVGDLLRFQQITLDRHTRVVTCQEKRVELTPREFDLLELFLLHPRQVLTREIILARIWGYDFEGDENIIEVYIRHLREKLHDTPPRLLQTVRGIGYSLRGET
jgi:two-component system response regulator MprA